MRTLVLAVCLIATTVSASVLPVATPLAAFPVDGGALLRGPVTSSVSVGPDGSSISSVEDSGAVGIAPRAAAAFSFAAPAVYPPPPAPVATYAAPAVLSPPPAPVAPVAYAAPAVLPPPPAPVAYAAPVPVAHAAPAPVAYAAPAPIPSGTLIDGPSGRIETAGSAYGVVAGTAPGPWAGAPAVVSAKVGW